MEDSGSIPGECQESTEYSLSTVSQTVPSMYASKLKLK